MNSRAENRYGDKCIVDHTPEEAVAAMSVISGTMGEFMKHRPASQVTVRSGSTLFGLMSSITTTEIHDRQAEQPKAAAMELKSEKPTARIVEQPARVEVVPGQGKPSARKADPLRIKAERDPSSKHGKYRIALEDLATQHQAGYSSQGKLAARFGVCKVTLIKRLEEDHKLSWTQFQKKYPVAVKRDAVGV